MGYVIGIDLGTANSCVAYMKDGRPCVIPDKDGRRTTPSVFAIDALQQPIVGYAAVKQMEMNRTNTIFGAKRLIGRKFQTPQVQGSAGRLPYKILAAENGDAWVEINSVPTSPEQVSAQVLNKMREIAEEHLGEKISQAVITVPAHFNDAQRQATKDAGTLAGLDVLRIVNEPTAAALAYGLDIVNREGNVDGGLADRTVAVFDLGAGTFDISILSLKEGVFDVLSTNGDTFLGGEDFDLAIMSHIIEEFKAQSGLDISQDRKALQRLKSVAREAKHQLSQAAKAEVNLNFLGQGNQHLQLEIDRKTMERIVSPILKRLEEPCLLAMDDASLKPADIDDIILVGGMTRMPSVKKHCAKIFGKSPLDTIDPDEAVASGAAIQAALLQGFVKGVSLLDVTSLSLGIEIQGGKTHVLVPRNSKIPVRVSEVFTTSAPNQPQVSIHVVQGESDFAPENKSLGYFELMGIRPARRGEPDIEVSFSIDHEGIVTVEAKDLQTEEMQKIEIIANSGLSDREIDRLLREARMEEEQKRRRQGGRGNIDTIAPCDDGGVSEKKNDLRSLIFITQAKLNTQGKEFKGKARTELESNLVAAREVLKNSNEVDELEKARKNLQMLAAVLDSFLERKL